MTLKDKFQQWFINDEEDEHYEGMVKLVSIEHEKVADEFAIGFLNWYFDKGQWITRNLDVKGLLEIYKKNNRL